jgi:hypothetical protein
MKAMLFFMVLNLRSWQASFELAPQYAPFHDWPFSAFASHFCAQIAGTACID